MDAPQGAPDWVEVLTAAERPDLWSAVGDENRFHSVWPEYNHHGNNTAYFGTLFPRYADVQVLVVDTRSGQVVARGRTIPFRWDGTLEDLPPGIDATGQRTMKEGVPDGGPGAAALPERVALAALAAEVLPTAQGQGLSSVVIGAMGQVARARGLHRLAAPVRPSWKDRYPITPIERYAQWRRPDGLPFDPWMRVHARLGATVVRAEPQSMEIARLVEEWETWVGMRFPEDGSYVFPGGLAPLVVEDGMGRYWEPNVWMLHELVAAAGGTDGRDGTETPA